MSDPTPELIKFSRLVADAFEQTANSQNVDVQKIREAQQDLEKVLTPESSTPSQPV
jgi:hypothetical protein